MIEAAGFALLRPWFLLAIPAVIAVAALFGRRGLGLAGWETAIDGPLRAALERMGRVVPGSGRADRALAATAVLLALALAGPAVERTDDGTFRNLDGVVLALDLSRSVATGGRLPEALTAARIVAEQAGSRPVALVVFAGDAYVASSFTTDAESLGTTIAVLDGETVPDPGSRPERALALARRTLEEADVIAGDVVLVGDGGGLGAAALREAEAIAARGGRVHALAVPGSPVAASGGAEPSVGRGLLEALARAGGGASGDIADPRPVADAVGGRRASRLAETGFAVLIWRDYGRLLLVLALVPALMLFRRRA
ncbi:VWA domain-containing protein [Prosthecomicrobium sp. N25]|uniref:VWA domain-containing protein n=1 Tax=Prosthecomicrobium sp. N25 TaxID=3129254 RepID=UPI0030788476